MRPPILLFALAAGLAVGATAHAGDLQVNRQQCHFATDYDVRVQPTGIRFEREHGSPASVVMHDGALSVDGRNVAVSAADAARLRTYEGHVRTLLPEVAAIAREGVDIGFGALATVAATFAESPAERSALGAQLDTQRKQALAAVDNGLGRGVWRQHSLDGLMESQVAGAVSTLVSTVTAKAVKAALSGDAHQVEALQARTDTLERTLEHEVEARADKLGERAEALCPRLAQLDTLQQQFEFRLADGSRLALVDHQADDGHEASQQTKPGTR
jgi:hypothetical protein